MNIFNNKLNKNFEKFSKDVSSKLNLLDTKLDLMRLDQEYKQPMKQSAPTGKYEEMPIAGSTEFADINDRFMTIFRNQIYNKLIGIMDNPMELINEYEKALYYNKNTINFVESTIRTLTITILRGLILKQLVGNEEPSSLVLEYVPTHSFHNVVKAIPAIDINKLFIHDIKNTHSNYIRIIFDHLDSNDCIIETSSGVRLGVPDGKRRTILRVLYSIYTERMYLYHLIK